MDDADDLLQRALLDAEACASVALKVSDLPLSEALTVIFHGRRDLGTLQTYVTHGGREAGSAVGASELLRVPCDLDLGDASTRDEAEELYAEQARSLRDAIVAADTVITGVYGMNFDYMPELHHRYSYYVCLAVMLLLDATLYRQFRRSGWL